MEIHCPKCMRGHQPGPCPVLDPEAIPDQPLWKPDEARPQTLEALLAEVTARLATTKVYEAPRQPVREPSPCPGCGRQTIASIDALCLTCELCLEVPSQFRWASFDAPDLVDRIPRREAIQEAREACTKRRVVLVGPAGHGKTSLAAAMFRHRASRGERNAWAAAWRLGVVRMQYDLGKGEPPMVKKALAAPILVIDDVGIEKNTPTNALPDILFERHQEGMATWLTTAMTRKQTADRYGDGIARRVFEGARVIDCGISEPKEPPYVDRRAGD